MKSTFKRETGMQVSAKRFKYVGMFRYRFKDRAQRPTYYGTMSLCDTFYIELSAREIARIRLDPKEYEAGSLRSFTWNQLRRTPGVAPQVRDLYRQIFNV